MNRNLTLSIYSAALLVSAFISTMANAAESRYKWAQEFEKGCERGAMQDCLMLAVVFARGDHNGRKAEKNPKLVKNYTDRSIELGTNGCKQGNLKFCYMLGVLYFEGELVSTEYQKGLDYVNKACTGGYKEACEWLRNVGL